MISMLLSDVTLGLTGRRVDVLVADGRVAAIEPAGSLPSGELRGGTLLPGLVDAHAHLLQWASARQRVSLADATSAAHAVTLLAGTLLAARAPDGEWVYGANVHAGLWPDRPHKTLLDAALPGRPAVLFSNDLHSVWLSSAALLVLGRDHSTGVFVEDECMALTAQLPAPALDVSDRWVLDATDAAAARGVTAIADYEYTDTVADWTRRLAIRSPGTRIRCVIAKFLLDTAIERGHRTGDALGELLSVGPLKVFLDGSLNTLTAHCHDAPGVLLEPLDALLPVLRRAVDHGISPALHAIGDYANTIALDAFAALGVGGRIEHAQLLRAADLPRFAELGVVAGVQPAHAPDDRDVADRHWAGRTDRAFAYRSLWTAGARLEFGSDAPVAPLDPWDAIASAVTRTDDHRAGWHPEQALPLEVALAATTGGRVTVEVGDVADLVLVGADLRNLPPDELREVPITATLLAGRLTHQAP